MADTWEIVETDITGLPQRLARDPSGTWVFCTRVVWEKHILARHPEITSVKDLIVVAIESPQRVELDLEDSRNRLYYVAVPRERAPFTHPMWLRVVVKYVSPPERNFEITGLLSSVYFVRKRGG